MFVLELSKPSGICLAAFVERRARRLPRLLALRHRLAHHERVGRSRPAPPRDRRRRCSTRCSSASTTPRRSTRSRSGAPTTGAIALYDRFRFRAAGVRRRYYAGQRRGRGRSCGARRRRCGARSTTSRAPRGARDLILALETCCDDTCAAVVTGAGEVRSNVVSSQGVHDRFGGVVPEIASRHHLELVNAVVDDALRPAGRRPRRRRARRRHPGPRAGRRAARRRRDRQGARRRAAAAARAGRPPAGPRRGELPRARTPIEPPFLCLIASGGHTLLARVDDHARLRGARADARRRRRRGVRQGRPAARARLPGRPGAVAARARRATRPRSRSRPRRASRASTSRSRGSRRRCSTRSATSGRTRRARRAADLAASYEHAIVEALMRADRARAGGRAGRAARDRRRRGREPAAARARRGARRRGQRPAARAVHGQRGDDRLRGALGRRRAVPGLPRARRLRDAGPARRAARGRSSEPARSAADGPRRRPLPRSRRIVAGGIVVAAAPRRPSRRGCSSRRAAAGRARRRAAAARSPTPSPFDGRSPREPAAPGTRVLVALPRPALGARPASRDLAPAQRAYVALARARGARAALGARARAGAAARTSSASTRTWNGFAATVRTRDLADLRRLGVRAQPVRRFYPATCRARRACPGRAPPVAAAPPAAAPVAVLASRRRRAAPAAGGPARPRL